MKNKKKYIENIKDQMTLDQKLYAQQAKNKQQNYL